MQVSCIIKIGGSLLAIPDLAERLSNFLADFSRPQPVVTCGGGPTVDLIRRWDRLHGLGEEASHWISVRALDINARVLSVLFPALEPVESPKEFAPIWARDGIPLYDAYRFLRDVDSAREDSLPRRWRVTSDSIAARMAVCFEAPELVLLKSTAPEIPISLEEAAKVGMVDPFFPTAAVEIPRVVIVNLRDEEPLEVTLEPRGEGGARTGVS